MKSHSKDSHFTETEKNWTTQNSDLKTAFLPELWEKKVSVFRTKSDPEALADVKLIELLHLLQKEPGESTISSKLHYLLQKARETAKLIDAEEDKEKKAVLKTSMPAFTPHGRLNTRNPNAEVRGFIPTGWVQIDIDGKDNQEFSPLELKQHVCSWPFVAYCAYSVTGSGVWALSPSNNNLSSTSEAILQYAHQEGIKVDSSKGKAEAELRFMSFDKEPYYNLNPETIQPLKVSRIPENTTKTNRQANSSSKSEIIQNLINLLNLAQEGTRHDKRLKVGNLAGGYVAAGLFTEEEITQILVSNYLENFPFDSSSIQKKEMKAITDGIRNGIQSPIYILEESIAVPVDQIEIEGDAFKIIQGSNSFELEKEEILERKPGLIHIKSSTFNRLNPQPKRIKHLTKKINPP